MCANSDTSATLNSIALLPPYARIARHDPTGGGSGAYASGPYDTHIAAAVRSAADPAGQSRARRQRRDLDGLQALAGTLRLSGPITQLAAGYLARVGGWVPACLDGWDCRCCEGECATGGYWIGGHLHG